ncbi:OSCP, subunit 5 of the stator stalk of mitochondrial F1F0 ATP synthase [Pisolithus tinctorius]|nr:OSCP, subunit 5 of the stator stalk of mitochondrial F1F0 ATP synthase [Pisolithus tinctorius]
MLSSAFRTSATSVVLGRGRRAASSIALKYSNAIYSAALKQSPQVLTKVQSELNAVSKSVNEVPELKAFVANPTLSAKERALGLDAILARAEGAGPKKEPISDLTKNLLFILAENGRLAQVPGVIEGFNELVAKYRGELEVLITSAAPLPKDLSTKLEAILRQSQAAQQAKSVKVTNKVNPSLLGGFVVDFGDKSIDLSVFSRVNKLNNVLQQSI